MVHPHLPRAERTTAREMLARHDVVSIGREHRIVEQSEVFFGDLTRISAVCIHQPDVVAPTRIARKEDRFSVGTESRLNLERETATEQFCCATCHRNRINITEQVEGDGFSIGAHIEVHPCALLGCEAVVFEFPVPGRIGDIPIWGLGVYHWRGKNYCCAGGGQADCAKVFCDHRA